MRHLHDDMPVCFSPPDLMWPLALAGREIKPEDFPLRLCSKGQEEKPSHILGLVEDLCLGHFERYGHFMTFFVNI